MAFPKVLLYDYDLAFCTHTARANCQSAVVEMPTRKIKTEGENMRGRCSLGSMIVATSFNDAGIYNYLNISFWFPVFACPQHHWWTHWRPERSSLWHSLLPWRRHCSCFCKCGKKCSFLLTLACLLSLSEDDLTICQCISPTITFPSPDTASLIVTRERREALALGSWCTDRWYDVFGLESLLWATDEEHDFEDAVQNPSATNSYCWRETI